MYSNETVVFIVFKSMFAEGSVTIVVTVHHHEMVVHSSTCCDERNRGGHEMMVRMSWLPAFLTGGSTGFNGLTR